MILLTLATMTTVDHEENNDNNDNGQPWRELTQTWTTKESIAT